MAAAPPVAAPALPRQLQARPQPLLQHGSQLRLRGDDLADDIGVLLHERAQAQRVGQHGLQGHSGGTGRDECGPAAEEKGCILQCTVNTDSRSTAAPCVNLLMFVLGCRHPTSFPASPSAAPLPSCPASSPRPLLPAFLTYALLPCNPPPAPPPPHTQQQLRHDRLHCHPTYFLPLPSPTLTFLPCLSPDPPPHHLLPNAPAVAV